MEKTQEENCLIAEFMGIEPETEYLVTHYADDKHFHGWISQSSYDDVKHLNTTGLEATRTKQNPYDTSWDWLMPVVEKIGLMSTGFHVNINTFDGCGIYDDQYRATGQGKSINSGINGNLIQVTYKAVAEFIKWYNQQTVTPKE